MYLQEVGPQERDLEHYDWIFTSMNWDKFKPHFEVISKTSLFVLKELISFRVQDYQYLFSEEILMHSYAKQVDLQE